MCWWWVMMEGKNKGLHFKDGDDDKSCYCPVPSPGMYFNMLVMLPSTWSLSYRPIKWARPRKSWKTVCTRKWENRLHIHWSYMSRIERRAERSERDQSYPYILLLQGSLDAWWSQAAPELELIQAWSRAGLGQAAPGASPKDMETLKS